MTIFNRLKIEREKLGLSQSAAGVIAGVTKQTFIQWEKGKSYPDAKEILLLQQAGFNINYILTGEHHYAISGASANLVARQDDLSQREYALLQNYRAADDDGKRAIEAASAALAQQKVKKA